MAATGEIAPGLHAVRAFGVDEVAKIVLALVASGAAWEAATINKDQAVDRAVRDADVLDEVAERALIRRCSDRLFAATRGIAARFVPFSLLAEVQIVRYQPGGKFVDHRDSPAAGAGPRALSLVCYLNDDFEGGATVFPELSATVQPASGIAIVFAPEVLHRAEPVIGGTKFALTAWYHTPATGR